jgi:tetratricopeptide (TPR) repeat protein
MAIRLRSVALVSTISVGLLCPSPFCRAQEADTEKTPAAEAPAESEEKPAAEEADGDEPEEHLSGTEVYNRMLPSTVWIKIDYTQDGQAWERYGTGWVYDIDRRLVVTNEHVVHGYDHLDAFLPQEIDGELQNDPTWYKQSGNKYSGKVIDRSTALDLALVQLDALPDNAVALKLAEKSPLPGERLFAIGGKPAGSEGLWIMGTGEVRQVYRRSHANGHFARIVESQLPSNGGNSGGAVVNDRCQVVAVVEGEMLNATLVRMFIDVNEVRGYLEQCDPLVEPVTAADFETRGARRHNEARYDVAIADYSAALRMEPKMASAMLNRGWAYFLKEDYETAKADFDAALKVDPELVSAYAGRGTSDREMGNYKAAIKDLTEALRRDATDADTYERRAKCYVLMGQHEKALKDRNQAVSLAHEHIDYLNGRGQTLRALKRFTEAQKDFEKAISLNPQRSDCYYELGYVYFDQEQYPQARMFFDMAVQRDSKAPQYFSMRGMSNYRLQQYEAAIADYNQALALKPDTPHYYWNMAYSYWGLDRYAESAQMYTEYIRLKPDEAKAYKERADVYDAMNRGDLAAKDRATAKRLSSGK